VNFITIKSRFNLSGERLDTGRVRGGNVARNAFDKALEHERLAVQYEPDRAVFHMKLGYLLLQRDPVAAIAEFKKVLALAPATARAHCDLVLAFEVAGDAKQAADEYGEALKLQPQFHEAKQGYERMQAKVR